MTQPLLDDCFKQAVVWAKTDHAEFPYVAEINGHSWRLRINDFPEQPLYTLFIDDQEIGNFDEWSLIWQR